jgi:hypothetical protein
MAGRSDDHTMVGIHAGTCMSNRRRGEPNGYNRLTFAGDTVSIVHRVWNDSAFRDASEKTYRRRGHMLDKVGPERVRPVEPRFFGLYGMPIVAGRKFAEADLRAGATAVIVNQVFVERVDACSDRSAGVNSGIRSGARTPACAARSAATDTPRNTGSARADTE